MRLSNIIDVSELITVRIGMSQIIVSRVYGVSLDELRHPTRGAANVAQARQVAIYLAHVVFSLNLSALARAFGRDPSTAAYAVQRVEEMREDPQTSQTLDWLEAMLRTAMETGQ
jgi:chromosomal replication initiation ATPase DnaA